LLGMKLLATTASSALGVPGGTIGPSLFLGAVLGGLFGALGALVLPGPVAGSGFYALLGMGAVMGASIQAPLAALTAILELAHNPEVILPGMLAIVTAGLTASELFHSESLFIAQLRGNGLDYKVNPVMQTLRRSGVASVMSQRFQRMERKVPRAKAEEVLREGPEWLLIDRGGGMPDLAMPAVDLARHLQEQSEGRIDLQKIPARRLQVGPIDLQATLQEALERIEGSHFEALYVERMTAPGIRHIYGVLTREQINAAYGAPRPWP
jgi:chloride channel protein, CIC family